MIALWHATAAAFNPFHTGVHKAVTARLDVTRCGGADVTRHSSSVLTSETAGHACRPGVKTATGATADNCVTPQVVVMATR